MNIHQMSALERDEVFHHAWVTSLMDTGHKEIAALIIDGNLDIYTDDWSVDVVVNLQADVLTYFERDSEAWGTAEQLLRKLFVLRFHDASNEAIAPEDVRVSIRIRLKPVDPNWRDLSRDLIAKSKDLNQGVVTELAFKRRQKAPIVYNEMKFASNAEVRVAQELEGRDVLFFPLPLAVRGDTGDRYNDHREVDFLICHHGRWGILEIAYHKGRYEQDQAKTQWFKDAGVACVEYALAEKAYSHPAEVVNTFLKNLALHR